MEEEVTSQKALDGLARWAEEHNSPTWYPPFPTNNPNSHKNKNKKKTKRNKNKSKGKRKRR